MRIALMQDKLTVGDPAGNATRVLKAAQEANSRQARLLVCPELALTAYPPADLLLRADFLMQVDRQINRLLIELPPSLGLIVGAPSALKGKIFNTAFYLRGGAIVASYHKMRLPNYSEFDELRWFTAGDKPCIINVDDVRCALTICEDLWSEEVAQAYGGAQADVIININASPFHLDKSRRRDEVLRARCRQTGLPIAYVNLVGGQDDLVFDGDSRFMAADGSPVFTAPTFTRGLYCAELRLPDTWSCHEIKAPETPIEGKLWEALLTGLRDYFADNRLRHAIIGLSGGIDSALTLLLAAQALGAEQVTAVMMRSQWTAAMSVADASALATRLGTHFYQLDIDAIKDCAVDSLRGMLPQDLGDHNAQLALENIQARLRANLLMTLANSRSGAAVIATSNKSEMAVGYTTLYGDLAGAYAPLKDVSKTRVYQLARYCNRDEEIIPQRIIDRPPSAELSAGQRDEDTLPPYKALDAIIEAFVERNDSYEDIVRAGIAEPEAVDQVLRWILKSEHKRRQAPPGPKITPRSFGRERRYPISSGFNPKGGFS